MNNYINLLIYIMSDIEEILNEIRNLKPDSPTCFNYKTSRSRIRKKRTSLKKSKNVSTIKKVLKERKRPR